MNPGTMKWLGIFSSPDRLTAYEKKVRELDKGIGSFLSFMPEGSANLSAGEGCLKGIPVAVKDNIAVKGQQLSCASRILQNFIAPYTATAVRRLEDEGACVVGKTNLDEFGMGSSTGHSALGITTNPWNPDCVPGGSSGGSAAAVAANLVPLALGSDTGGSVRQPANFCGIYGLKPSYGSVSRYGLTAYASSLDVIGLMARDIDLLELSYKVICGADEMDQSSMDIIHAPERTGRHLAVLNFDDDMLDAPVLHAYRNAQTIFKDAGYRLSFVSLSTLDYIVPAYYTIATAEASTNLARYNGIRYGHAPNFAENPVELMRKARHEGFGDEVKLRILLGTYVLRSGFQDQYYGRAQKIRALIRRELKQMFQTYDGLLMPVFPTQAFGVGDSGMDDYQQRLADVFTCLANLTGVPAIAVPTGVENALPSGVQLLAPVFGEESLFEAARVMEKEFPLQNPQNALNIEDLYE